MVIRILDHVQTYSSYSDGEVIFRLIAAEFDAGRAVAVSFDGIVAISSAFVNSALIRLVESYDFAFIREHLDFLDTTKQINRVIRDRFLFALNAESATSAPQLSTPSK